MKALVLAGGFPQIALIKELKKRKTTVILADYYEEPVAMPYADKFFRVSTLDVDAIKEIAREEEVDFLITVCTDQALLTVALVSEHLGLPCYINYKTALNVTNKQHMKSVFVNNGIPTAKYKILRDVDNIYVEDIDYPLIVKPVDSNSSKGIKKVQNKAELKIAFMDAIQFSRTNTVVVEEYIEGKEISVDVYVEDGKAHILSISNSEKIEDKEKFIIFRGNYPALDIESVKKEIQKIVQKIADAFHLRNSPMLVQMIQKGNKVFVLEFSARSGGGVKNRMIKKASGFDVIKAVVDLTYGQKPHVGKKIEESKYIINEFIYCKPGVFSHLEGFEELQEEGIISDYYIFKSKGTVMERVASSGDRICGFTIQSDTNEEMIKKHNVAISRMKVIDEEGRDIMRHDLMAPLHI